MTVLLSIFFKGILLIAVYGPSVIWASGQTEVTEYDYESKRIYSSTVGGEEEEPFTESLNLRTTEEPDEIATTFDFQRKPTTIRSNHKKSFFHPSTYSSPEQKQNSANYVKYSKVDNEDAGKLFTRKPIIVKYVEGTTPSLADSSSVSVINKNYESIYPKNDEAKTVAPDKVKLMSSQAEYEYSSVHSDENADNDYNEEPQSHTSTSKVPLDNYKNTEWKNSELKKKNKKDSSFDSIDSADKISSLKTDKSSKDLNFKSEKPFIKHHLNSSTISAIKPDAFDNSYSTKKNSSVTDNYKAVKNISVNHESGSNLLEIESTNSEMTKNAKSNSVSDIPNVNSVINKNSVTAENVEIVNKTPTTKYSIKDPSLDAINETIEFKSLQSSKIGSNYDIYVKETNHSSPVTFAKSENDGVSDMPSVNSVIKSVPAEKVEIFNKTPTIKYSIKDLSVDVINGTAAKSNSLQSSTIGSNYDSSMKEKNGTLPIKLDKPKIIKPILQWEPTTETFVNLITKSYEIPDNSILNVNLSTIENSNDIKKKNLLVKHTASFITPSSLTKNVDNKTSTITNPVPKFNVAFKDMAGFTSTSKIVSLSVTTDLPDSFVTTIAKSTILPSSEGLHTSRTYATSIMDSSSTEENSFDEALTTTNPTTLSNNLLVKTITGINTRKQPMKFGFLSSTPLSEITSATEHLDFSTKININYSTSSVRSSRRPSLIDSTLKHFNKTDNVPTEADARTFTPWSTRLQKFKSIFSTEPVVTISSPSISQTTNSDIDSLTEYQPSGSSGLFETSTESSAMIELSTKVSNDYTTPENLLTSSVTRLNVSLKYDVSSTKETSEPVTANPVSQLTSQSESLSPVTFKFETSVPLPHLTSPPNSEETYSTESVRSSSLLNDSDFSIKDYGSNTSDLAFSDTPVSLSTLIYSSDVPVFITDNPQNSFNVTSSIKTNSKSVSAVSGTTNIMRNSSTSENFSYQLTTSSLSSPSDSTEHEDELSYTTDLVRILTSSESITASPGVHENQSEELLPFPTITKSSSVTESQFDEVSSNSSHDITSYSLSNVTNEDTLEISTVPSPSFVNHSYSSGSSPFLDNYITTTTTTTPTTTPTTTTTTTTPTTTTPTTTTTSTTITTTTFTTTEHFVTNRNSLITTHEITTFPSPSFHNDSDYSDEIEDIDWSLSNTSDHETLNNHHLLTPLTTEDNMHLSSSPKSSDVNSTSKIHNNKNDDFTTETTESSISESTSSTTFEIDLFTNSSYIYSTSDQYYHNVTVVPVTNKTNFSISSETVITKFDIEKTTAVYQTEDEATTIFQYTTSSNSRDIITPNWTRNNVPEYLVLNVDASMSQLCQSEPLLRKVIIQLFKNGTGRDLQSNQIIFLNLTPDQCSKNLKNTREPVQIEVTFLSESGQSVSASLNEDFMQLFQHKGLGDFKVRDVQLLRQNHDDETNLSTTLAAITIFIAVICLLLLGILLIILRKRQKGGDFRRRCTPVSLDDYSLDNISVYNSVRRKNAIRASKRSYGNPAFDDPGAPSHQLNFAALANFCSNRKAIDEEYSLIPMVSPKMDELPPGAETKNRYANIIPLPETRVHLSVSEGDNQPLADYINANYVKGPKGADKFYIACQAPMQSTVNDFWRMIWEQQSKIILMLTDLHENGVEKCYDYLPPSEVLDCHRLFGDYQVTLKKREVREKYVISLLQLKNLESNLWREVTHMWYMSWPHQGVPDEGTSIIAFLIEARSYMRSTSGPHIIHCSPGTGRTGTVIAIDLCIRDFEANRMVDIPKTVYALRRDRAGSVQTKDQYAFVYQVLNIYAAKLTGGALDSI